MPWCWRSARTSRVSPVVIGPGRPGDPCPISRSRSSREPDGARATLPRDYCRWLGTLTQRQSGAERQCGRGRAHTYGVTPRILPPLIGLRIEDAQIQGLNVQLYTATLAGLQINAGPSDQALGRLTRAARKGQVDLGDLRA